MKQQQRRESLLQPSSTAAVIIQHLERNFPYFPLDGGRGFLLLV